MFSFFKRKRQQEAPRVSSAMELLDRVNRLRSVQLSFFQSLLNLTDEVSDRIVSQYEQFGTFNTLEVHAFCASIVATAVAGSDLPEDETPIIVDIYLALWVDSVAQHGDAINGLALKDQMRRLSAEYCPLIIRAANELTPQIMHDPDSVAVRLVRNVDRLAGVDRDEVQQSVTAVNFKVAATEAIRIVGGLASTSADV